MSHLTDFFRELPEGFSQFVLKVLSNGSYFQAMAEVPPQQGFIQQIRFGAHDARKAFEFSELPFTQFFSSILSCTWDRFFWNSIHDKQGVEFMELFLQVIKNMNVTTFGNPNNAPFRTPLNTS